MKRSSLTLVLALVLASCGRPNSSSDVYRLPWPDESGEIALRDVRISTLSDPQHFSGSAARILVEPGDGGTTIVGAKPVGRFERSASGVMIPSDWFTMEATTTYAHIEKLRAIDERAGAGSALSYPLSVGVETSVTSYGQSSTNNALYDPKLNSLLIVPYNEGDLPIDLNPGILAHEHFHFIFQRIVLSRVKDDGLQTSCQGATVDAAVTAQPETSKTTDEKIAATAKAMPPHVYNAYVLRAMNEGFADFYGWLYSNDDSFVSKSLPSQYFARTLSVESGRIDNEGLIRTHLVDYFHPDQILPDAARAHNAYTIGTVYARFLRRIAQELEDAGTAPDEARFVVARALISSLSTVADAAATQYETAFLSPNVFLSSFVSGLPSLSKAMCTSIDEFHADDATYSRPAACAADPDPTTPAMKKDGAK